MDLPRRWRALVARFPTLADVSTLLSGTVLAQVVVLVTAGIVSRLYSPAEIGSFAAFMAIPQTVAVVAGLRYDMAVVLPERDADARVLVRAALTIAALMSLVTSLVTWWMAPTLATLVRHPELTGWLAWSGVVVMTSSVVTTMGYWFTRTLNYRAISTNRVEQQGVIQLVKIAAGAAGHGGIGGQMGAQIAGQGVAAATLVWRGRDAWRGSREGAATTRQLLHRHRRMSLLNAPNALVDAVRTNGIVLLVGYWYAGSTQGQFSQAWTLMQAPLALINGAVSQVFFQKFATVARGDMTRLVQRSVKVSLAAGIVPFALLAVLSPELFPWFLGDRWDQAGTIAQALVPWLFLNLITSPISTVFVVTDRQSLMLVFACVYAAAPLALLWVMGGAGVGIVSTVWVVSLVQAALLAFLVWLTHRVAASWDAGSIPDEGVEAS